MTKTLLEEVRLDRWLMAARFYKTRSQAAKACEGRKIKVNGVTAKSHKTIRVGDKITLHHNGRYRDIQIAGLAERGLPPAVARELYHEEEKIKLSEEDRELMSMMRNLERRNQPKFKGRPTKKLRRDIDKLKDHTTLS